MNALLLSMHLHERGAVEHENKEKRIFFSDSFLMSMLQNSADNMILFTEDERNFTL